MSFIEDLAEAAGFGPDDEGEGPSWIDRLAPAAYTPPSGLRITFDYEDQNTGADKKTSAHEFPDANGVLVQDHGLGARRFPSRIFFSGPDHDKQAAVFEAAIQETGRGVLETPLYGEHEVVPFGKYRRFDLLVRGANQTVFEVMFLKTIGAVYPLFEEDAASAVQSALDLFGDAGAAEFASALQQTSVSETQGILDTINGLVDQVGEGLDKVAAVQQVVADQFEDIISTIDNTIDTLVAQPLTLAFETKRLIQTPATALANITDRLTSYGNLASNIFGASNAVSDPGGPGGKGPRIDANTGVGNDAEGPNRFHCRSLFAMNYVAGSTLSTLFTNTDTAGTSGVPAIQRQQADADRTDVAAQNKFESSTQALDAAALVLEQLDALVTWRDENFQALAGDSGDFISTPSNTDQGGAIEALQRAVGLGAGFLIQLSFALPRERTVVLTAPRTFLDLCWELKGTIVDNELDFLIDSNDLSGDEIFELPVGREMVYYNE